MGKIIIKETVCGAYFFHVFDNEDNFREWLLGHFSCIDCDSKISRVNSLPCGALKWQEWDKGCFNVYKGEFGEYWWEDEDNAKMAV